MTLKKAILATVAYHDIFNYPLKNEEIFMYLINKKSTLKTVERSIKYLVQKKLIYSKLNYVYLANNTNLELTRLKREKYSQIKLKKAKLYAKILHFLPTVKCVCITGALSMNNCTQNDDIDLLVICQKRTLWTTRFLANIILLPFKRKPKDKYIKNKACLNIFIDESDLKIKTRNLYTAHEISQMKLVWDKDKCYQRFINKNIWFLKFLPNWKPHNRGVNKYKHNNLSIPIFLENMLKEIQTSYMQSKMTTETIGDTQLFFHPGNTQDKILKKYYQKIANL